MSYPLSASSLDRALRCAASCALPQAKSDSYKASLGSAIHDVIATAKDLTLEGAIANHPDYEDELRAVPWDSIDIIDSSVRSGRHEVAYAYNADDGSVRELGLNIGRNYGKLSDDEIPVTLDYEEVRGEVLFIDDVKTGHYSPPAAQSAQLKMQALAAARRHGLGRVRASFLKVVDGQVWREPADIHSDDMDGFAAELVGLMGAYREAREAVREGKNPDVYEGEHCQYCPAFKSCWAKVGLLRGLAAGEFEVPPLNPFEPEAAGAAYSGFKLAEQVVKKLKASLREYAENVGPIPVRDGLAYGRTPNAGVREYTVKQEEVSNGV